MVVFWSLAASDSKAVEEEFNEAIEQGKDVVPVCLTIPDYHCRCVNINASICAAPWPRHSPGRGRSHSLVRNGTQLSLVYCVAEICMFSPLKHSPDFDLYQVFVASDFVEKTETGSVRVNCQSHIEVSRGGRNIFRFASANE